LLLVDVAGPVLLACYLAAGRLTLTLLGRDIVSSRHLLTTR